MLIYNPAAGQREVEQELKEATHYLEDRGWQVAWRITRGRGDATTYAREAAAMGYDVAIAAGGDGTIGQVVNGIAGTSTALGVLPVGTTNVWAREIGVPIRTPLHPDAIWDAAQLLADGERRVVDVGRVNETYFLMWAGIGFDAQVNVEVERRPEAKRRLGMLAFAISALAHTVILTGNRMNIQLDGKKLSRRVLLVVASNIQLYGGIMRIAPMASMNDGMLDVCIFTGYSGLSAYRHFFSVLFGLHIRSPEVIYHQGRRVVVETRQPLPVHADGDTVGTTPVTIDVVPNYLHIIVPRHTEAGHLGHRVHRAGHVPTIAETLANFLGRIRHEL